MSCLGACIMLADGMATITVRKLDEATVEALKERAKTNGRSMEEEVRRVLETAAARFDPATGKLPPGEETVALFRELRKTISGGRAFDAVADLRELRDSD